MNITPAQANPSAPSALPKNLPDLFTISAIAISAYALSDFIHEGIGHGGMCLLTGGHPALLSTVEFQCNGGADRLVAAGGVLANVAAAIFFVVASRFVSRATRLRYFLWLLMVVNLLDAAGYFLFSGVGNFGDWAEVIHGLQPAWAWRVALVILGAALYLAFVLFCASELRPFLGSEHPERLRRARHLTLTPYFSGSIFLCISALPNPGGMFLVAVSAAAASFGGTSGFAWMDSWYRGSWFPPVSHQMPPLTRSWAWIVVAALIAVGFCAVLGPSIKFR